MWLIWVVLSITVVELDRCGRMGREIKMAGNQVIQKESYVS